jgi:N utilization substance protein B
MKTAKDPRHQNRRKIVRQLFAESFTHQSNLLEPTKKVLKKTKTLDKRIQQSAPMWPVDKLNKIDLAILRLSVYELEHTKTPPKVIIDEAVELAKEFASENSPAFINGVLGAILKKETIKDELIKIDN